MLHGGSEVSKNEIRCNNAKIIWARVHREFFVESPEQFDPVIAGNTYIKEEILH